MASRDQIENNITLIEEFLAIYIEMYFSKSSRAKHFWEKISSVNECYVFGGFVVDYLKKDNNHRDIDIVVDEINETNIKIFEHFNGIRNSFGGYKIKIDNIQIDIWAVKDTWAIRKMNYLDFDLFSILPSTSFFNSTAIIYSINEKRLFFKNSFLSYLSGTLDILFEENPYPELCIIKSYQNVVNDKLSLSSSLRNYILNKYNSVKDKFDSIQIRHYGEVKYSSNELEEFYLNIKDLNLKKEKSKAKEINENQLALFSF